MVEEKGVAEEKEKIIVEKRKKEKAIAGKSG